jgi:hypothetical protein
VHHIERVLGNTVEEAGRRHGRRRAVDSGHVPGPLETPAGIVQPTGAKIDVPTADFWYLRDGKIETFNCYVGFSIMIAQNGRDARLRIGGRGVCSRALSRCSSKAMRGPTATHRPPELRPHGSRESRRLQRRYLDQLDQRTASRRGS